MAALDWSQCAAVESIPGKVSGVWVFILFDHGTPKGFAPCCPVIPSTRRKQGLTRSAELDILSAAATASHAKDA